MFAGSAASGIAGEAGSATTARELAHGSLITDLLEGGKRAVISNHCA
jgi:hypothetical protein